ncbi:hypothetical protein Ctob_010798 [Chrysochromulina tobinii]|uniref:Uncharacterized protein n=1 Tax=Chrysochromulina tobinii TaxID=1460289 RepID=A0A0M0JYV9_9EUKA|nr:hypothetical protein Ctob_010798 [Chrysochromulina tobinii]|eukprot:KOO31759.1 hypothetical protein Ctob_010798 [Chrysochromulina sp. CCMP291]
MIQPTNEAIADDEPESTVEEIMQRGKTRERLAAERAQAEARHVEGDVREAFAQQRAAEAEAKERHMARELETMRISLVSMQHKETTSRDAVLVALMETMKLMKPEPREVKVHTPKDIRDGIVPTCPMEKNVTEMREWATTLAGAASGLSAKGSELVGMTLRADPRTVHVAHSTDEYVDANRWLARQVLASIKPETDAARVFLKEVRSDINLIESGVSLVAKLLKHVSTTDSLKMESAELRFQTTVYFKGGMSHDQVRLAAAAFKADYTARPFFDNRTYALLAAMLKELPPSLKEPFVRDELDNLLTLEMKGQRDGTDLMPAWDDFLLKIAVRLRNATGEIKKNVTPEASSLDYRGAVTGKGGGKGGKGGKGRQGRGQRQRRQRQGRKQRRRQRRRYKL